MPKKDIENIIIVGYGEVGRAFGLQMERANIPLTYIDPIAKTLGNMSNISDHLPATLPDASLVLGAVPSTAALSVAQNMSKYTTEFLYIDVSASSHNLMQDCASLLDKETAHFVDAAIMGSVNLSGSGAPICLSGPHATQAEDILKQLGFTATSLPNSKAGDASGLKLLRTLMTKGIEALAIECLSAARQMGLQSEIRASLTDISARPFPELLDAMVISHVTHAKRREHELEAAINQVKSLGLSAPVNEAALKAFKASVNRLENTNTPIDIDQALDLLRPTEK